LEGCRSEPHSEGLAWPMEGLSPERKKKKKKRGARDKRNRLTLPSLPELEMGVEKRPSF